jgi:hypothetical protein
VLGNGKKIRFWHDVCPLKISFHNLFEICNQQDWSVHRILVGGFPNLSFRRIFDLREEKEWLELSQILEVISLTDDKNSVRWVLEKTKTFSTTSLYTELTFSGFTNKWLLCVWHSKLPLKIRVFLWQVFNDKIQSAVQLKKRNWSGPIECKLCGCEESTVHLFFRCVVSQFCWCICRDILGWDFVPSHSDDLTILCRELSMKQTQKLMFLFGCVLWSIWLTRNDYVFVI